MDFLKNFVEKLIQNTISFGTSHSTVFNCIHSLANEAEKKETIAVCKWYGRASSERFHSISFSFTFKSVKLAKFNAARVAVVISGSDYIMIYSDTDRCDAMRYDEMD